MIHKECNGQEEELSLAEAAELAEKKADAGFKLHVSGLVSGFPANSSAVGERKWFFRAKDSL
jgi:hypothetical protein